MKKLFAILFASICILAFSVAPAMAAEPYEDTSDDICASLSPDLPNYETLCGGKGEAELMENVRNILNAVYFWVAIITVIVIIIGGVKYMTSQGDAGKVKSAKDTIMYAIIGLIVTLLAFAITNFILGAVGGGAAGGGGAGGGGTGGGGTGGGGIGGSAVTSLAITSADKIPEGGTLQLKVKITPNYADNKKLTFSSSDPSVATISDSGMITAKKSGTTTITATAANGVTTSKTVTIEKVVKVTNIKLEPSASSVAIGKTITIKATITPSDATDAELTWTTSDASIATVTNKGVLTGKKEGTVTVTVSTVSGVKATTSITVEPNVTKYSAVFEQRNMNGMDYFINVPEGATSNMPLILFLHGDGEAGSANAVKGLKQVTYARGSKKFIFLAPVGKRASGGGTEWVSSSTQTSLKALVDKYVTDYKIDTKRIYIWGFSRGAIGTWGMVNKYPTFFAAAVPVSCGGSINASNFKTTKVYALAGSQESGYISTMQSMVNEINKAGGSAKFESVAGQSHSTITANFPYEKVIDNWLLKQSR